MKKLLSSIIFSALCSTLFAQSIEPFVSTIPQDLCPGGVTEEHLINKDYDANTSKYIHFDISEVSDLQLRLLPSEEGKEIICAIKTFKSTGEDSEIIFYDEQWQRIGEQRIRIEDIIREADILAKAKRIITPVLIKAELSEASTDLTATISTVMLSEDDEKQLEGIEMQTTFKWNGNIFK